MPTQYNLIIKNDSLRAGTSSKFKFKLSTVCTHVSVETISAMLWRVSAKFWQVLYEEGLGGLKVWEEGRFGWPYPQIP